MTQDLSYSSQEKDVQTELDNPDNKYKTLFEHINGAVLLTTFDGQIIEANHRASDFFGYRVNELLCLSLKNLLLKNLDWDEFQEDIAAQGGLNVETYVVCKDGYNLPVELSISLFQMNKKPVMFVLMWDISERKSSEGKLKESEKKYHGLFQYSTDGILVLDARGTIIDVNTRLCEMLDCNKEKIIRNNLFNLELFSIKSLPSVVYQFEQLLSDKKAQYYTAQIKNKEGNFFDVEVSSFFLVKKDNEVDNFILIIRDITDRNLSERNQNIERELFKTLMRTIPDAIFFKDDQNRYILVNKAKAERLNLTVDEFVNKTDFDLMSETLARKNTEEENSILNTGKPILNKIEKITNFDGYEKWNLVIKVPRFNSNFEVIGTLGISRDITSEKNIEEELARVGERYRSIFDNSTFVIIQTNENEIISSWNRAAEQILQMSYDSLYSKVIKDLFVEEEWNRIQSIFHGQNENNPPIETKINKNNAEQLDIKLSISTSFDDHNRVIGYSYIFHEIIKK